MNQRRRCGMRGCYSGGCENYRRLAYDAVYYGRKLGQILRDLPFLSLEQETEETLGMNTASSIRTSIKSYQITEYHIPWGNNLQRMR